MQGHACDKRSRLPPCRFQRFCLCAPIRQRIYTDIYGTLLDKAPIIEHMVPLAAIFAHLLALGDLDATLECSMQNPSMQHAIPILEKHTPFKATKHHTVQVYNPPRLWISVAHSTIPSDATKVRQQCRLESHSGTSTDSWQRSIWHCFGHPGGGGMISSTPSANAVFQATKWLQKASWRFAGTKWKPTKTEPTLLQFGQAGVWYPKISLWKHRAESSTKTISQPGLTIKNELDTKSYGNTLGD